MNYPSNATWFHGCAHIYICAYIYGNFVCLFLCIFINVTIYKLKEKIF